MLIYPQNTGFVSESLREDTRSSMEGAGLGERGQ